MTRLDRLLLHMPRLRRLVLDREAFAAHCTRLQRELDENLERERTLCQELETSAKDARALTAHGTRLQGELDGILERERTLRQELETSARTRAGSPLTARACRANWTEAWNASALSARNSKPPQRKPARSPPPRAAALPSTRECATTGTVAPSPRPATSSLPSSRPAPRSPSSSPANPTSANHIQSDLENICQARDPGSMRHRRNRLRRRPAHQGAGCHLRRSPRHSVSPEMIRLAGEKGGRAAERLALRQHGRRSLRAALFIVPLCLFVPRLRSTFPSNRSLKATFAKFTACSFLAPCSNSR